MRKLLLLLLCLIPLRSFAWSNMDITLSFGPSIAQSGNIQKLGDPSLVTGLEFNYYFKENHGIGFGSSNEYDFDGGSKFNNYDNLSAHGFDVHYSYRHFFSPKWRAILSPGFGTQTIYKGYTDPYTGWYYYDDLTTAFMVNYRLWFDYILSEWDTNGNDGNFFIGAGVMQTFSFNDEFRGVDISGSRLSGLFRAGIGF
jgi:hypothetical protein